MQAYVHDSLQASITEEGAAALAEISAAPGGDAPTPKDSAGSDDVAVQALARAQADAKIAAAQAKASEELAAWAVMQAKTR